MALVACFKHFNLPQADLLQAGYTGLLKAAMLFDAARDVRFSTYAGWWIRASLHDYVLTNWTNVHGGTSAA